MNMHKCKNDVLKSVLVLLLGLSSGCGNTMAVSSDSHKETSVIDEPVVEEKEPVVSEATLFMMGDALLHDPIEYSVRQSDGTFHFTLLDRIGEIASSYDLRYYNQETILGGDEFGIHGYPSFNGVQAWGEYMVNDLGFNMVSLANNHSLDMGIEGLQNSMAFWAGHPEVYSTGTFLSQEDYDAIEVREINGISYAMISYTYGMNGLYPPEGMEYAVACYDGRIEELLNKVERASEMADVVITAIHWGDEYHMYPNEFQQTLAQQLSDAGCDIIIGNHPHAIQPVQWINGNRTICFYALGNAVAAQYDESCIQMMGGLTIRKTEMPDGEVNIEIDDVHADLTYLYFNNTYLNDFAVVPFAEMTDDTYVYDHEGVYNQYKEVITCMDSSIRVGGFE